MELVVEEGDRMYIIVGFFALLVMFLDIFEDGE